jgi:hypothetical protein
MHAKSIIYAAWPSTGGETCRVMGVPNPGHHGLPQFSEPGNGRNADAKPNTDESARIDTKK